MSILSVSYQTEQFVAHFWPVIDNMSLTGITLSPNGTASFETNDTETQATLYGEKKWFWFIIYLQNIKVLVLSVSKLI